MNKQKTIVIIIIGLCIIGIIAIISLVFSKKDSKPINSNNNYSTIDLNISDLQKKAFRTDADILLLTNTDKYGITFSTKTYDFVIELTPNDIKNVNDIRKEAEMELIKIAGIKKEKLCDIPVDVIIPPSYSLELSGKSYGLSFCKNFQPINVKK